MPPPPTDHIEAAEREFTHPRISDVELMLRAGQVVTDEHKIPYRVVRYLDPRDGWAAMGFWLARWKPHCTVQRFLQLTKLGYLDGALEEGSMVRRFRVRDERLAKAALELLGRR